MEAEQIQKIRQLYENVALSALTEREKELMALLFPEQSSNSVFKQLKPGRYRILQFSAEQFAEVAENLTYLLPDLTVINQENHLAIERFSGDNLTKTELFETFKSLAQDTGLEISAYVGLFAEKDELEELFSEEKSAFERHLSFSEFIFAQALANVKSPVLSRIREVLHENPEDQDLVRSLYLTSGNQAQAAKILFVHRNTLLNKIKKYEQKYGLQLSGSDLTLAFHLL